MTPAELSHRYCGPAVPATKLSPPHICDQAICDQAVVDNSETQPSFSPTNPTAHRHKLTETHTQPSHWVAHPKDHQIMGKAMLE